MKKHKLYKSVKTLPIYNLNEIINTSDLRYLFVSYDDRHDSDFSVNFKNYDLETVFENIMFEYADLVDDHNMRASTKRDFLIKEWSIIYDIVSEVIALYNIYEDESILKILETLDPKYKINTSKSVKPQINKLVNKMKGLKNKIRIYKSKSIKDDKDDDPTSKQIDLEEQSIKMEIALGLSREIDIRTTTVSYYFKLRKILKEKQEVNGKD